MYEIYKKLLDQKGLKSADVSRATGISNMTLSDWKNGKSKPKHEKMILIAEFLDTSVDYLETGEEHQGTLEARVTKDEALMRRLKKYMKLSQEKKDLVLNMIDNIKEDDVI